MPKRFSGPRSGKVMDSSPMRDGARQRDTGERERVGTCQCKGAWSTAQYCLWRRRPGTSGRDLGRNVETGSNDDSTHVAGSFDHHVCLFIISFDCLTVASSLKDSQWSDLDSPLLNRRLVSLSLSLSLCPRRHRLAAAAASRLYLIAWLVSSLSPLFLTLDACGISRQRSL